MSIQRWNMRAVISTVDIEKSPSGMYVKYEDYAEDIATLKAQCDELLAEVEEWRAIKAAYLIEYAARPNKLHPRQYHGHAHDLDGIWDRDNGALAGCQCVVCMMHRAAVASAEETEE